MLNVTFKQLRYFDALATQGHFTRAAEVCAISQPALSMQIRDLEATLGHALFERGGRGLRLTRFGQDFVLRARDILRAVADLEDLARAQGPGLAGRLNLGVIPTIAPYLLPRLVGNLRQAHPGLDLHLRETVTARLIEELSTGRLDAAIVALPVDEPTLTEVTLFSESFVLIRAAAEAAKPVPDREALAQEKLLLLEEGHCFRDQALAYCGTNPGAQRDGLDGTSLATLVQMVAAGLGMTLIPEMAIPVETRHTAVSIARFAGAQPGRRIGMVWRRRSPLTAQMHELAALVRRAAGAPEDGRPAG
ncbi:hydrogen peroxide-inducible genes activator [Pseudooceanicola sp.]|uniref:hydrogen peroxide-inducible genes activator n=1 Tax=Pseudooceanicola sp. TaxID=1914328 RepID=UPI00260DD306|nr:hydrogen peroxide-inducible genes activator [Pseudooceanicola sp.]MDF1855304.1 LysR substrate-binding domain-containing protein [Pseudooceanicola sp.]